MGFFKKEIVGIDFHDYSAELVSILRDGDKTTLEAYNRVVMPPDVIRNGEIIKPKELADVLKKLFRDANPHRVMAKNIAIMLPASKVITHIFTMPANLNSSEIKKALPYEAEKVIPFVMADLYYDFIVLDKEDKSKKHASQSILFACIKKEVADQYSEILKSIGLVPSLFGISAEALGYSIPSQRLRAKTTLIIDVDTLAVNYLILKDGKIKYFFSVNEGGYKLINTLAKDLQLSEDFIMEYKEKNKLNSTKKMQQVKTFFDKSYARAVAIVQDQQDNKHIGEIDDILLTGKFLNIDEFYDLAKSYFPNKNIEIGDPKMSINIDSSKFAAQQDGKKTTPYAIYFTNAIGIALRGFQGNIKGGINLMPEALKESFSNRKKSLFMAIGALTMVSISLLIATFLYFKYTDLTFVRRHLEIEKSSIEKLLYGTRYQQVREEITSFNSEVSALSAIDAQLFSMPALIDDVYKLIPQGVEITSFSYDDENLLFGINGISVTRDKLLETKKNFEDAEFASEVIAPISNYDEKSQISFLMKIKLNFNQLQKYGSDRDAK